MDGLLIKDKNNIESMIYEVRGQQVMLDSDLAKLYGCETGNLNRARLRNINRFPINFAFQITKEEYIYLKCQSGISNIDLRTINRNLPYVYTEQGVAMLSAVLHTDIAVNMSIKIINAFILMRKYISNELNSINIVNSKLLEYDKRISLVEDTLLKLNEKQKTNTIFFEGQIYDAYSLLMKILKKAKKEIIIIDNYCDENLMDILKDIDKDILIITKYVKEILIKKYNSQYQNIKIIKNNSFHDRFIIIDRKVLYHSGASFKDLGKKCFAINLIEDKKIISDIVINIQINN